MHRAVVSLPDGLVPQERWLLGELCAAAGVRVADERAGAARSTPRGISRPPPRCSRATRSSTARSDEHGRFPASASALAPGAAPLDDLVLALREAAAGAPAPEYPGGARFAVALTHDIDTPVALEQARRAGRGRAPQGARSRAATWPRRASRRPVSRSRRCTSSSAATPTGRTAASPMAEQRRGFRSTCFVLAAHRDPHDGAAPEAYDARRARLVQQLDAARARGRRCTPATRASPTSALLAEERAVLAELLGGPIAGNRHHYLRLPWHDGIRALDRLGFSYDTTLGHAERPGPRAGLSFPFRPWDVAAGEAAAHPRAPARADGRDARGGALPRALARARPGPRSSACSITSHDVRRLRERPLAQRSLRPRLRARLGPALRPPARRHRRARRPCRARRPTLTAYWRDERCAS